jgi:hypothetical protein
MPRSLARGGLADVLRHARRRWTEADAAAVLSALDASGLSVYAFAEREGLDADRLYRWRLRLQGSRRHRSPAFVEIKPAATSPIEVLLRSGLVLRVPGGFDEGALRRLVQVLDQGGEC